jgi:hypothetical protein
MEVVPGFRTLPWRSGGWRPEIDGRSWEHHRSRGIEGTQSVRISHVWNVETSTGSGAIVPVSRP